MLSVYHFLDYFFFAFHTLLILFNLFGWAVKRWRKLNAVTLLLTGFSWFVLGIWYGWGYCFCTDWHWEVRQQLGLTDMSTSYVHFLVLKLTGFDLPVRLVDVSTLVGYLTSVVISAVLNVRDLHKRTKTATHVH